MCIIAARWPPTGRSSMPAMIAARRWILRWGRGWLLKGGFREGSLNFGILRPFCSFFWKKKKKKKEEEEEEQEGREKKGWGMRLCGVGEGGSVGV